MSDMSREMLEVASELKIELETKGEAAAVMGETPDERAWMRGAAPLVAEWLRAQGLPARVSYFKQNGERWVRFSLDGVPDG